MLKPIWVAAVFITASISTYAQVLQTVDDEGSGQAANLKRINKKAKYGVFTSLHEISFSTAKGLNNKPIVTAKEDGTIDMVSLENNTVVGYMLPYNQFVKVSDYDFSIYYKKNFKSQKYPPERVSLTDDGIFLDDSYGYFYGFKATEMGQRSRFSYNYNYTDAKYLTRIFFHSHIPVNEKKIVFKVPTWLQLEITEKNFDGYKIKKEIKKEKDFTVYTYTATALNGIKSEAASLARPYYLPHIIITVRSYTVDKTQYNGFKGLDDMYAWYNLLYKKAENKDEVVKTQVQQLIQGKVTDEEKIKSIYYWVQDNIRYIAFEEGYSGFVPQTEQEVYKNKYGDCKGMANLLTQMLKQAGYDAHFAWIGTREIPYDRTEIQSMCVDNHAITVLYFNNKTYFLDGTEKFAPLGKNAYRIQGKKVLVQNGDDYKIETVPDALVTDNVLKTKATFKLNGNKINGHVILNFDGETRNLFHNIYNSLPANKRKEFITTLVELNSNSAEATNIKTSDFKNRDIPLVLEADVELSNKVTVVDKTAYTSIDFFPGTITAFIPEEDRENPLDIDQVFSTVDEVTLELPAGSKIKALPKNFNASFKQNNLQGAYNITGNKLTLNKQMKFQSPVIFKQDFTEWKTFINSIKEFNRSNVTIEL